MNNIFLLIYIIYQQKIINDNPSGPPARLNKAKKPDFFLLIL